MPSYYDYFLKYFQQRLQMAFARFYWVDSVSGRFMGGGEGEAVHWSRQPRRQGSAEVHRGVQSAKISHHLAGRKTSLSLLKSFTTQMLGCFKIKYSSKL